MNGVFNRVFRNELTGSGKRRSTQPIQAANVRPESLEQRVLLNGDVYFVDGVGGNGPGGNDNNDGMSVNTAFATIQKAADVAQPGDIIQIRGGVYREEVSLPRSGVDGSPIVFQAFNSEDVTVTATDLLTGFTQTVETNDNANVYVADLVGSTSNSLLNRHELTVFVNGQLVQEAKSKNNADYLRASTWSTVNSNTGGGATLTDTDLVGGPDLTGGFVRVLTSDFVSVMRRITAHNRTSGTITLASPTGGSPNGRAYLVHDTRSLVDSAGEWFFDEENGKFYLWAPGGGDPDNFTVEVKRRAEAFDLNGNDYIHFVGLTMTGGDLDMVGSDHILIDDVHIIAPDRIFGPEFGTTRQSLVVDGEHNIIRNSEFEQIWSAAIRLNGSHNQVINNYIHDAAFNGGGSGGIATGTRPGVENLISHNTFTRMGRSAIVGAGSRNIYQHNDFSDVALITTDTGAVYAFNSSYDGSVFRFNTFHNIDAKFSSGFYVDNFVTDVAFHNNITYDVQPFGYKANQPNSFILYYNNTAFNTGRVDVAFPQFDSQYSTRFYNNIVSSLDGDLNTGSDPADVSNNFTTSSSGNFLGASTGDFRLNANSGAVDSGREIPGITDGFFGSAPDAGAIEHSPNHQRFLTGHDFDSPPTVSYDLTGPLYGQNFVRDSSFEQLFDQWDVTGTPTILTQIASNLRSDALPRYGRRAVALGSGDAVSQTITGLKPNTLYTLGGWAKPIRQIVEAESFDPASSVTTLGNIRGQVTVSPLSNNDFLIYRNIDFGAGDLIDELTLMVTGTKTSDQVEVRLGSANGPLIDTVNLPSNNSLARATSALDVSSVTGVQDVVLVFRGTGNIGQLESLRFSNSADRVELRASNFGRNDQVLEIGRRTHTGATQRLTFATGPNATSATVSVTNPAGSGHTAYVDYVTVREEDPVAPSVVDTTQVRYDYDLGTPSSPVLNNFNRISPLSNGDIYWTGDVVDSIDRGANSTPGVNASNRDFIFGDGTSQLNHKVANGRWRLQINVGDAIQARDDISIKAEGQVISNDVDSDIAEFTTTIGFVDVTDGELNIEFEDLGGSDSEWIFNRLTLTKVADEPTIIDPTLEQYDYDLGTPTSPVLLPRFTRVSPLTNGDLGFSGGSVLSLDRGQLPGINAANRDFIFRNSARTFFHKVVNGRWRFQLNLGDPLADRDDISVAAEGVVVDDDIDFTAGNVVTVIDRVNIFDGEINLTFDDLGGADPDWVVSRISLYRENAQPVAGDATFTVDEESANGTSVGTVSASDLDTGDTLTYAITNGNAAGGFAIDPDTGEITVADSSVLDFETTPTFSLEVTVTDDGGVPFSDTATVTINLNDVNELGDAPVIAGLPGSQQIFVNGGFTPISDAVTVTDSDSANFAGGLFRALVFNTTFQPGDELRVRTGDGVSVSSQLVGGSIRVDGVLIGTIEFRDLRRVDVRLNANATPAFVTRLARNMNLQVTQDGPDRTMRLLVEEANGLRGQADTTIDTVDDTAPPVITGVPTTAVVLPGNGFTSLAPNGTVSDADSTNYQNGIFRALVFNNTVQPGDEIRLRSGNGLSVSSQLIGGSVRVDGVLVGTISFRDDRRVDVALNRNATLARVQRLVQGVQYQSSTAGPDRTIRILVEQANAVRGQADLQVTTTLNNVDPPEINSVPGLSTVTADGSFTAIAPAATVTDPDSSNFNGGFYRALAFASTSQTGDELLLQNVGGVNVASQTLGASVTVDGVFIGQITFLSDSRFDVRFNANATPARVTKLLQATAFSATQDGANRQVRLIVEEADGVRDQVDTFLDTALPDNGANAATVVPTPRPVALWPQDEDRELLDAVMAGAF